MAEGEWLERFMCAYAATCDSSACAYGRDWPFSFESLEPARLVEELRGGKLLKRPLPGFYLLSPSLLSGEEVSSLLHAQEAELAKHHHLLRYFRTSTGHHVLSSLCRSDWWAA
ncbi:hypothetical protein K8638_34685 [Myxococcus sp. RHST-1-4]|nr:hypothetical protein [Myxococcus sp. RHSTA-1-4]